MANKQDLIRDSESNIVEITSKKGVQEGVEIILRQNMPLLPQNASTERIKNAAGFYIANKTDLMALDGKGKLQMLYGVLKEAIVGCEAGLDYDILIFKGKPTICRKKEGWFKIIELIKPSEIVKFVVNVATIGDEISFNPVEEKVIHIPKGEKGQKFNDIIAAYAFVKFANGFEKTVFLDKSDITHMRQMSPSKDSEYSPWSAHSIKMVKTKAAKELAKELYTLFSGRLNGALQQAILSDETPVARVDKSGFVTHDDNDQHEPESDQDTIAVGHRELDDDEIDMNDLPL